MCRLLLVRSGTKFKITGHLKKFAEISRNSKEFQGHGWGCSYLDKNRWNIYRNIKPVWEDDLEQFPETCFLMAHARSAFRNEGIIVENNMPFRAGQWVFIFNGELHAVRLKEKGRTGAEKIFNFIKRFNKGEMLKALERGVGIIKERSGFVKAMNIILSDGRGIYLSSMFNADPEYFTVQYKNTGNTLILCSDKYGEEKGWKGIENNTIAKLA